MIPTKRINIGDMFCRNGSALIYSVQDIEGNSILLQCWCDGKEVLKPFWVTNKHHLIQEQYRV